MPEKIIQWQEMPNFVIWNRLKQIRKNRKMTRWDLSLESGVSSNYLQQIEHGIDGGVSDEIQTKIAKALDLPVDQIFPTRCQGMVVLATGEKLAAAKPKKKDR